MELDHNKFMNLVMEKTNQKLNALQAQCIVLDAQLQLVIEQNNSLLEQLQKYTSKEKTVKESK